MLATSVRAWTLALVAALAAVGPAEGCSHHGRHDHDDTPFSAEHLEELQRKWGHEVRRRPKELVLCFASPGSVLLTCPHLNC